MSSSSSPSTSPSKNGTAVVVNPVGPKSQLDAIRDKAEVAMGESVDAFLSKPWQTTAVILSWLSTALSIISTFTPWFRTSSGPTTLRKSLVSLVYYFLREKKERLSIPSLHVLRILTNFFFSLFLSSSTYLMYIPNLFTAEGTFSMIVTVYTTELRYCNEVSGVIRTNNTDPNFVNAAECTVVSLPDIAPVLNFFYQAGTVALAFLILSLMFSIPAAYITYLRRIGSLWRIPERFYILRKGKVTPILHVLAAIFLNVAWGNYVGGVFSNYKASNLQKVIFYDLPFNDPILTGGFGCAVAAWLCSIVAAILTFVFQEEISRTLPPTASDVKNRENSTSTANLASENTKTGASIAGAYMDPPVSDWNSGSSSHGNTNSSSTGTTPAFSTISIASYVSAVPPSLPAATRIGNNNNNNNGSSSSYQFSSGGSTDNAPPLPPKSGRGAAVLLAQGKGIHSTTSVSESTRNFSLPPPLPDEDDDQDNNATI